VPSRAPDAPAPEAEAPLPPPSVDAFGHPYRWLALGKIKYLEVVFGGAEPEEALPIVVLFHGLGDRPRLPTGGDPRERRLRMIFPEAPYRFDAGFAWYPIRVRDREPEAMAAALVQTGNELAELLARLEARYPGPCKPIVSGFSQGGIVTFALAVEHPRAMEAAFPMSAWLPPALVEHATARAPRLPRLRMTHGGADEVVPFEETRRIVDRLASEGAPIELTVFEGVGHRFDDAMKRDLDRWIGESVERCASAP
jgi:phospholipase/carboxylesterase